MCDPHIEHVDEYLALAEAAGGTVGLSPGGDGTEPFAEIESLGSEEASFQTRRSPLCRW